MNEHRQMQQCWCHHGNGDGTAAMATVDSRGSERAEQEETMRATKNSAFGTL